MRLPGNAPLNGQQTVKKATVHKKHQGGDKEGAEVFAKKAEKDKKESKAVHQATGAYMNGRTAKQPHQQAGKKVTVKEHPVGLFFVNKVNGGAQEEQRNGIGEQVQEVAVKQGTEKNSAYPQQRAGVNSQEAQVNQPGDFHEKHRPH